MAEALDRGVTDVHEQAEIGDDVGGVVQPASSGGVVQPASSGAAAMGPGQVDGDNSSTPVSSPSGAETAPRSVGGGMSTGGKKRMSYVDAAMRGSGGGALGRFRQRSLASSPLGAVEARNIVGVAGVVVEEAVASGSTPQPVAATASGIPHSPVTCGASSPAVRSSVRITSPEVQVTAHSPFVPPTTTEASARRSTAPAAPNQPPPSMAPSTSEALAAAAAALRSLGGSAVGPGSPNAAGAHGTSNRGGKGGGAVHVPTWQEPESLVRSWP